MGNVCSFVIISGMGRYSLCKHHCSFDHLAIQEGRNAFLFRASERMPKLSDFHDNYGLISFVLSFIIIGFFALIALLIMNVILTTIAAVKSNNGEAYKYPLTIHFIK